MNAPASGFRDQHMPSTDVDICLCTYDRESVRETLGSLAALDYDMSRVRVILADNAQTDARREWLTTLGRDFALNLVYVHAPSRNISIARNACLDASKAPLVAFIDDDETVSKDWLKTLVAAVSVPGVDGVFGTVRAVYPPSAPRWMLGSGLHDTVATVGEGGRVRTGYTCNALIKRAVIGDLRFEIELGRTGGEDTVFFFRLNQQGCRLFYAPEAVSYEDVPDVRLRLGWMMQRHFRFGQTHGRMVRMEKGLSVPDAVASVAKAAYCVLTALILAPLPALRTRALNRLALHAGVLLSVLGMREITLY